MMHHKNCVILVLFVSAACTTPNPTYRPPDACQSTCSAPTGVCEPNTSACVQCTAQDSTACTGLTPVCGTENVCVGCRMHSQCSSNVCLPDGSCSSDDQVAYVDPIGGGTACTRASPCASLQTALKTSKPYVKLTGTTKENVTIDRQNVTILADPGAKLTSDVPKTDLLTISASSQVAIFDLEVGGAKKMDDLGGIGIHVQDAAISLDRVTLFSNDSYGIHASGGSLSISNAVVKGSQFGIFISGGTLNLSESTITDNVYYGIEGRAATININKSTISRSTGGSGVYSSGGTLNISQSTISDHNFYGILFSRGGLLNLARSKISKNRFTGVFIDDAATFHITNNFVVANGTAGASGSGYGGLIVFPSDVAASRLEFNTIVDNRANSGNGTGGVHCVKGFAVRNSLIVNNSAPDTGALCTVENSYIGPVNPAIFVNADATDYHLAAGAPAGPAAIRDAVDCSGPTEDYDGDARPQRDRCDVGADEYRPDAM